MKKYYSGV